MKPFIAAIAGILSAVILVRIGELAGHFLFPVDPEVLKLEPMAMRDLMLHLPAKNLLAVVVAHFIGLLVGLLVSRLIVRTSILTVYFVAGIMIFLSLINVLILPHPVWFICADLGLQLVVAFLFIRQLGKK